MLKQEILKAKVILETNGQEVLAANGMKSVRLFLLGMPLLTLTTENILQGEVQAKLFI